MKADDIERLARAARVEAGGFGVSGIMYHPESVAAIVAQARREALEDAARVCDMIEHGHDPDGHRVAGVAWECADAIRAMK